MSTPAALDPLSLFRLHGRVAVVTGASSGLGDRFARVLHVRGIILPGSRNKVSHLRRCTFREAGGRPLRSTNKLRRILYFRGIVVSVAGALTDPDYATLSSHVFCIATLR